MSGMSSGLDHLWAGWRSVRSTIQATPPEATASTSRSQRALRQPERGSGGITAGRDGTAGRTRVSGSTGSRSRGGRVSGPGG